MNLKKHKKIAWKIAMNLESAQLTPAELKKRSRIAELCYVVIAVTA